MPKGILFSIGLILAGIGLLLYEPVVTLYGDYRLKQQALEYERLVSQLDDSQLEEITSQAGFFYEDSLSITGTDVIGVLKIPAINLILPVFHNSDDATLDKGIGHLPQSSMLTLENGSNILLAGHRYTFGSTMFRHLDEINQGDELILEVLDDTRTYTVDQIWTFDRKDESAFLESFAVDGNRDLLTLMTCHPYGSDEQRLMIQAEETDDEPVTNCIDTTGYQTYIQDLDTGIVHDPSCFQDGAIVYSLPEDLLRSDYVLHECINVSEMNGGEEHDQERMAGCL